MFQLAQFNAALTEIATNLDDHGLTSLAGVHKAQGHVDAQARMTPGRRQSVPARPIHDGRAHRPVNTSLGIEMLRLEYERTDRFSGLGRGKDGQVLQEETVDGRRRQRLGVVGLSQLLRRRR